MIGLAVLDSDTARWQAIAARLRGAMLLGACADFDHESLSMMDAVAFFQLPQKEQPSIEQMLQAGKDVLLSVDAGLSKASLQKWTDVARAAKVRLAIVNPDRYLPSRQLIRQQLDTGKLGEPGLIRVHRWESAGSMLSDLDLILWYFGKPANIVHGLENNGCTQIHLGFPDGGMALLDYARRLPAGNRYYSLSVIGSSGAAYADDHQNRQLVYQGGSPRAVDAGEGAIQWATLLQEFIDSKGLASCSTWSDVLTLSAAVAQALHTKQAVVPDGVS